MERLLTLLDSVRVLESKYHRRSQEHHLANSTRLLVNKCSNTGLGLNASFTKAILPRIRRRMTVVMINLEEAVCRRRSKVVEEEVTLEIS